jgi:hypothetical protein
MKKRFKTIILFLVVGALVSTCNKKKESGCVHENANVYIKVLDNNGVQLANATINVFDSFENYEKARTQKNNSAFAIDSIKSNSSNEVFVGMDPYVEHWVLVTYYDSTLLKYFTSELTSSKMDKLQSCSDYHITVNLLPLGANVAFWTDSPLNLPIIVKFDNVLDTLKQSTTTQPIDAANPGRPKEVVFPVKSGTYAYQATSQDGCSWQGQLTVVDGQFISVKLEMCQRAILAFYYSSLSFMPSSKHVIDIYIDNNPSSAGTLTAPITSASYSGSGSCSTPAIDHVLYLYLEPGVTHTYKAVSGPGSNGIPCIWTGTTNVLSTNCASNPPIFLQQGCN